MQIVYFFSLCLVLPAIGDWFSPDLGQELVRLVPDTPIIVPAVIAGWLSPLLAGSIARFIRHLFWQKSVHDQPIGSATDAP